MVHAFLLLVYLGAGDNRQLASNDMYFWSIERCNYFASNISKRYGNYGLSAYLDSEDRITSYCITKYVDAEGVKIYD